MLIQNLSIDSPSHSKVVFALFWTIWIIRERPFNLKGGGGGVGVFVSFRIFFSDNTRVSIIVFFPECNIRLYDKNSESDYFFFLHQNQNIFFNNIGNQNIFFRITHNPPFKLNGRSLSNYTNSIQVLFLTLLCNDILSVWCSIKCTGSARGHTS
jgi:hypothetical protein